MQVTFCWRVNSSFRCFTLVSKGELRTEGEQSADQVSVDFIILWSSNTTRLLEKCSGCKILWHTTDYGRTYGGIGDSRRLDSGWWEGIVPKFLPQELCHGFSTSWESSIRKIKLYYPGNQTQDLDSYPAGRYSYHNRSTEICESLQNYKRALWCW